MKLFLAREYSDADGGFCVFDETAMPRYHAVNVTDTAGCHITLIDAEGGKAAEIYHKSLVLGYFTIKCGGRRYILVPCMKERFGFAIYGSTYRFLGDIASGRFSLFDVDKSPVMTQKKCWGEYGDGYELKIYHDNKEIFAVAVAICAALYLTAGDKSPAPA